MKLADLSDAQLLPLSETRHRVQFTASNDLRKKLERAQDLMRHANAEGDLAVVVERASEIIDERKATLRGYPDRRAARSSSGTASDLGNLRVRCRAHNALHAEQTFGMEHVDRRIRERRIGEREDPRQRGYGSQSCALAASGLVNLGFRAAEVQRALDTVSARHRADDLTAVSVQTILREALAVLK